MCQNVHKGMEERAGWLKTKVLGVVGSKSLGPHEYISLWFNDLRHVIVYLCLFMITVNK